MNSGGGVTVGFAGKSNASSSLVGEGVGVVSVVRIVDGFAADRIEDVGIVVVVGLFKLGCMLVEELSDDGKAVRGDFLVADTDDMYSRNVLQSRIFILSSDPNNNKIVSRSWEI